MTDAPDLVTVSLSRSLRSETARHPAFRRDSAETRGETASLKALARLVLTRDTRRDGERDRVSRPASQIEGASETAKLQSESGCSTDGYARAAQSEARAAAAIAASSAPTPAADRAAASRGEAGAERAAIVEHDGKIPRDWAEGFARLDPDRPPGDVPPHRWWRFVDDVGLFLDSPFCAVAATFGWGPYDLFGCDRDRPFARIDRAGLLWLLGGAKLVLLAKDTATIETRTGARQTWRRKPNEPGRVLAWELAG